MSWSHAACNNFDKPFLTTVFALAHILDAMSRTFVSVTSCMRWQLHVQCKFLQQMLRLMFKQIEG